MLNIDLLRTTYRNGKFFCRFADPDKEENFQTARTLLLIFRNGVGRCRSEITDMSRRAALGAQDPKFAAGLEKLLCDMAVFSAADPERDYGELRRELFKRSGALIAQKGDFSEEHYRKQLGTCAFDIYGDLPDFEILNSFKEISEKELIHRYNTALVQTMLLYAGKLTVTIREPDTAELRKVVKFMKFFRLLAELTQLDAGLLRMDISGPGALLENARKYGVLLGSFFPALLNLKHYNIESEVEIRGRKGKLLLDESSGLVSHYRNIAAYVPEEIKLFHRCVREKKSAWEIVGETPFINMGKEGVCFPDLSFCRSDGTVCHLELFHRWHKWSFQPRMEFLNENPDLPLLLGVDRGAVNDEEFDSLCREFPLAAARTFRFRDFPGVETVLKMLDKFAENKKPCSRQRPVKR